MNRVVVVTGASSGIGRATAIELSARGDDVVLLARRKDALDETAASCGGRTLCISADITREVEVTRAVAAVLDRWGRIDAWINNAGVAMYASLETGPIAEHLRVIETNLVGALYGARAVLPVFRAQRRGTLVNIGSVLSWIGQPFVPTYVISKFALRGLTDAIRAEVADIPDIHACGIYPFALDTPHFASCANHVGRMPRAIPPMQSPETVARAIASVLDRPRRATFVPPVVRIGLVAHAVAPRLTERVLLAALRRFHFAGRRDRDSGNLFDTPYPAALHGRTPPIVGLPRLLAWCAAKLVTGAVP